MSLTIQENDDDSKEQKIKRSVKRRSKISIKEEETSCKQESSKSHTSFSKIKKEHFTPISRKVSTDASSLFKTKLAIVDAFPSERDEFVWDAIIDYAKLESTSEVHREKITQADATAKEEFINYMSVYLRHLQ